MNEEMNEGMGLPMAEGLGTPLPSIADLNKMVADELLEKPDDEEEKRERAEFVKRWIDTIKKSKKHFEGRFKKMRDDQEFARGKQWVGQTENDERYVANITQRHINQRVSSLYAKNPTAVAKRRQTIDFTIWDESTQSITEAMQMLQMGQQAMAMGAMPTPEQAAPFIQAQALIAELQEVKQRRLMMDRMGKTMEILFHYFMRELEPSFKTQAKQLIRRTETNGVGYVKLGFQRQMERRPDVGAKLGDLTQRLSYLRGLAGSAMSESREGSDSYEKSLAEIEELEVGVQQLMNQPMLIIKEGLVFDFPRSTQIIVDKNCINLKGFIGADWIAHEFLFSCDEVKEIYGIDLGGKATPYSEATDGSATVAQITNAPNSPNMTDAKILLWEVYHKPSGTMFTIADGFDGYVEEPEAPRVELERFWPIYALTFNDVEDEKDIYPDSDVRLLRAMQVEHNRSREGLREHRIANRPAYGGVKGILEEQDKVKLASHSINELIEFNVPVGTDIKTILQPMAKVPIDPNVYDTSPFFDDVQKVVGAQQADFGGVSGVAATEVSVAEGSRLSTLQSNIDDLDDFLSELARGSGQILLKEMSVETVKKIAGHGAVWPQLSAQDVADELYLEIEAGSSGRPNRAQEIANLERIAPTLLQVPGINPAWLAKKVVKVVDDTVDLSDAVIESMPSMTALNAMSGNPQPATGDPTTDPAQQGKEGGDKTQNAQQTGGGAQPSYRQPSDNMGA